jgi:hypothetical protein
MKNILLVALVLFPLSATASYLCPNGIYVDKGPCKLCPDGIYIGAGGRCTLTPANGYVRQIDNAPPKLMPNGKYVEGGKKTTMCPDGTFVAGSRCKLMPNGKYVGVR